MNNSQTNNYVMVVEDDKLLLESILKSLENNQLHAKGFTGGTEALRHIEETEEIPSVIWLDYYLEDTNGMVFVNLLKKNENCRDVPVLVVSNSSEGDKIKNLLSLGVKDYFIKANYSMQDLIEEVKKYL